ncbi:MAG: hypothetical protein EBU82_07045 [Flavobacteriia bacterium]|jgi:hypothetical protein|nr:hypothetical protein [Flavobacteriia bacterium]
MDASILFLIALIALAYFYLTMRTCKEGFGDPIPTGELRKPCKSSVVLNQGMDAPYVKKRLLDVDDYEYNLVFQQEGDREVSKALYNKLQSQYPLDWSVQPPSSAHFQAGLQQYKESFTGSPVSQPGPDPYKEMGNEALTPPDTTAAQMEEKKILQLYQPAKTDSLGTYQLDDADALIKRIYDAKGLVPEVKKKENNVYEVIGTRRKDEKIVYEDENPPVQRAPVAEAGEGTITVPATAVDTAAGLDPFFTPGASTHMDRWDYTKFTPGLERMFAPTYPTVEWY